MGVRPWVIGAVAAALMLAACGEGRDVPAPAAGDSLPAAGDPALWFTAGGLAAVGVPGPAVASPVDPGASTFTAHVIRLGCSDGVTGTVLTPAVAETDTTVIVTFTVEQLRGDGDVTCPGNDAVPYEVELGGPIGERQLIDGGCFSEPVSRTTFCRGTAVRWTPGDASAAPVTPAPSTPSVVPAGSVIENATVPTLDLDGVVPESVPMVISEHLVRVQLAVRDAVGTDVFAGAAFTNTANDALTIYGTDAAAIEAELDAIGTPLRDRITVVETQYSVAEIERYAAEAQVRLDTAGIAGAAVVQFGVDAVAIELETANGEPDDDIERAAADVLDGLPVSITFSRPYVDG